MAVHKDNEIPRGCDPLGISFARKNRLTNPVNLRIIPISKPNTSQTIETEKVLQRALTESGEAEKPQNALEYMGR